MIPVRLKIEGFLSYRQSVELDFSGFDLACISGANGAGKSALLDAITWALFGRARKYDESVINSHPSVEAAEVTFDFDYEGNRYRVQRTNPRGKTSSVEFFIRSQAAESASHWKPLTERTLRETDSKIEKTLRMDYDTFTNASFFLQGKADQFATARPGERKRILSNILGLEVWESYRDEASRRRRDTEKEVKELDGRLTEIQNELDEGPQREADLRALEERLGELAEQRQARARDLEVVKALHTSVEEQHKLVNTLKTQLENARRQSERLTTTLAERREEKQGFDSVLEKSKAIEGAYEAWQAARKELEAIEEVAEAYRKHEALRHEPLGSIQAEAARLAEEKKSLIAKQKELQEKIALEKELQSQFEKCQAKITEAEERLARRETVDEENRSLQAKHAEAKAENPRLKKEMEDLRSRLNHLEAAKEPACPVCERPLSEDERDELIRQYYKEGESRRDQYYANKELLDNFEDHLHRLGVEMVNLKDVEAELREANRRLDQIKNQLTQLKEEQQRWEQLGAPRLAEVTRIIAEESYATAARTRLQEIEAEMAELGYDVQAHEQLRQAEAAGREAEADKRALDHAQATLAPISREIENLKAQFLDQSEVVSTLTEEHDEAIAKLAAAEADLPELNTVEAELHNIQEQENRLRMSVGGARQKVAVLETLEARKAGLQDTREELTQSIADLKQLERAFGKDGVPALLIEQALPEIEETTNNLLTRLTNGRMSFSFLTQREFKDSQREDLKETLDMVISDSVGERDYEMFSGGEAFRVNFSIRLALSEVLAKRAGARLQTLVIDEGFGSQDVEGRQRLVEAINLVRDDFEKILVITHLEELKEAFPTRIEVEKTLQGSQVQVV
jgi:DNA repair protein SbcC/Rad50